MTDRKERPIDIPTRKFVRKRWSNPWRWKRTALVVLSFGAVSVLMLVGEGWLYERLIQRDTNRAYAVHDLLIALATVHLWTEEHVTGDEIDLDEIASNLELARALADALIEGSDSPRLSYPIEPIEDGPHLERMRGVRSGVELFRELSFERQTLYRQGEPVGIGSEFDVRYDRVYREFFSEARAFESALEERQAWNLGLARSLFRMIIVSWSSIVILAVVGLWRLERRGMKAEAALREREEQLLQSQKMDAVGRLAGGIAHDINNYLGAILSQAELVRRKTGDTAASNIAAIIRSVSKSSALIEQLLAFSRQQPVQPVVLNLNRLIEDNVAIMVERLIGEQIQLDARLQPDLGNVRIDPSQLEQILVNLAVNARDAMPSGGSLTIETADCTIDDGTLHTNPPVVAGDYVMLAVSDTGTGIPPEIRKEIFEPFFTTKTGRNNSGLGLSTIYGIVEQNDGGVSLISEVGRGSTFRIYLPRIDAPEAGVEIRSPLVGEHLSGDGSILLVEDNDELRLSTRSMLEGFGYQVTATSTGEEALTVFGEVGHEVDLVITDVVMPGMSGKELADRIHEKNPHMKVLFVSGHTDDIVLTHGIREGEVDFLPKPVAPDRLARRIRSLLALSWKN